MDALELFRRADNGGNCTKDTCPASASIYGYAPSLAANALFLAIFLLSGLIHSVQGIKFKTWSFLIVMVIGNLCEAAGYGGRIMLHNDAFSDAGFKLQIVLLTFAPAFLAAGIYFTLKHIIIIFGAEFSRLRPKWYTYIFITCDIFSIVLQGAGGALASVANGPGDSLMDVGDNLMITGLAFQVFTLLIFGVLATEYALRVRTHKNELNPMTFDLRRSRKFRFFLVALCIAYSAILIRCIYRVAEMAGGWGNSIMQNEAGFIALDSVMCVVATVALNAFHPGWCFDYRSMGGATEKTVVSAGSDTEEMATKTSSV
ncbi:sphingoid long-chain base transporter RSB1 [Rhizodiscina lignyota]|uniref:Sphingoid long-chain base transporter RSB1 n=1 Tax=Rhizodiscina lignyota TaxID=1504668 RepID=A0A9P4MAM4_9PEZI|nr:sphingoid long-chain base transporter RSB1 [Rhizodiscina lignyota]